MSLCIGICAQGAGACIYEDLHFWCYAEHTNYIDINIYPATPKRLRIIQKASTSTMQIDKFSLSNLLRDDIPCDKVT